MSHRWRGGGTALCAVGSWWLLWWGGECLLIGLMKQVCHLILLYPGVSAAGLVCAWISVDLLHYVGAYYLVLV
jgi:hypothetical protein